MCCSSSGSLLQVLIHLQIAVQKVCQFKEGTSKSPKLIFPSRCFGEIMTVMIKSPADRHPQAGPQLIKTLKQVRAMHIPELGGPITEHEVRQAVINLKTLEGRWIRHKL